jgi:hypothetical protein
MVVGLVRRTALNQRQYGDLSRALRRRRSVLLLERQLKVRTGDGNKVMAMLGKGHVLCEMTLFGDEVRSADALSVTDTKEF